MNIVLAIIVLSVIIIVHEFGHFILAKANGVMVLEFSLGFGPKLLHFKKGETEYSLKLLPFGGACMMLGEDFMQQEEEQNTEAAEAGIQQQYDMTRSFGAKSVWARMSILAAGPIFNFILAFILAVFIIGYLGYDPSNLSVVQENSPAAQAGLMEGDRITSINGRNVAFARELSLYTAIYPEKTMEISYLRDGGKHTATVVPDYYTNTSYKTGITITGTGMISAVTEDSAADKAGMRANDLIQRIDGTAVTQSSEIVDIIGRCEGRTLSIDVLRDGKEVNLSVTPVMTETDGYYVGMYCSGARVKVSPFATLGYSVREVGYWIRYVFDSLGMIVRGKVTINDFSGPVGVVNIIGEVVEESRQEGNIMVLLNLFNMAVMISANLGVMNLLPLPALDGGRLVFCIIEALRGKPVSREKEGMVHFVGMVLLMILMVVILFNDVKKIF